MEKTIPDTNATTNPADKPSSYTVKATCLVSANMKPTNPIGIREEENNNLISFSHVHMQESIHTHGPVKKHYYMSSHTQI